MSAHLAPRVLGWAAPRRRLSPPAVINLIFLAPPLMIVAIAAMTVNPLTNLVDIVGLSCIEPAHMLGGDAVALIVRGITFRTASRVALVVGTILSAVNQGTVIATAARSRPRWVRVAINYVVPYTVASIGYLSPFRVAKSQETAGPGAAADY